MIFERTPVCSLYIIHSIYFRMAIIPCDRGNCAHAFRGQDFGWRESLCSSSAVVKLCLRQNNKLKKNNPCCRRTSCEGAVESFHVCMLFTCCCMYAYSLLSFLTCTCFMFTMSSLLDEAIVCLLYMLRICFYVWTCSSVLGILFVVCGWCIYVLGEIDRDICVYTYICRERERARLTHTHIYIYIHIYTCIYLYTYLYTCIHAYVYGEEVAIT